MTSSKNYPRIAITTGEPSGIGPDIIVGIAQQHFPAKLLVVGSAELLKQRATMLQLPLEILSVDAFNSDKQHIPGTLVVFDIPLRKECQPQQLNPDNAGYVIETLETAAQFCLDGYVDAITTAPIHKGCINDAGIPFVGHTEFFATLSHSDHVVMMLQAKQLRVALTTTHIPLSKVAMMLTPTLLENTLRVLHHDLKRWFGIENPLIAVCGLNPHAGEQGHLGREEIDIINPVIQKLQNEQVAIKGPISADSMFTPYHLEHVDVVLTMYHDQGLPVLKYVGFGDAVNITLGLPFIRTSVDHGTALLIAGTGKADCGSMRQAILTAIDMANVKYAES